VGPLTDGVGGWITGGCFGASAADAAAPAGPTEGTAIPMSDEDGPVGDVGGANREDDADDVPYATGPSGCGDDGSLGECPLGRRATCDGRGASGG